MSHSNGDGKGAEINYLLDKGINLAVRPFDGIALKALKDRQLYTGFYNTNQDNRGFVSGKNAYTAKNAVKQFIYGNGNLTPYYGNDII
jgi:hypothetical protein